MPSHRKHGLVSRSSIPTKRDTGTSCLGRSPLPGVIGLGGLFDLFDLVSRRRFDDSKAVTYALKHKQPSPMGQCARYTTAAVAAGFGVVDVGEKSAPTAASVYVGMMVRHLLLPHIETPESARRYGVQVLLPLGFLPVGSLLADATRKDVQLPLDYTPQVGDIIIFDGNTAVKDGRLAFHGHMQICTTVTALGQTWTSDGFQKTMMPYWNGNAKSPDYHGWNQVAYTVYRFQWSNLISKSVVCPR